MIEAPALNFWAIGPELVLGAGALLTLLVGLLKTPWARGVGAAIAVAALTIAAAIAFAEFDQVRVGEWPDGAAVGQIDSDMAANFARILAALAGIATIVFAWGRRMHDRREGEYYTLILCAVLGMGIFAASGSLVTLFVGLELFSISLYVLCALEAERVQSLEAGLKYLIVGGLSSAILLYGSALLYGATGTFDLSRMGGLISGGEANGLLLYAGAAMVIAALGFKASAAPLHWWTPDVYDGAPTTVTAFMAAATKVAAFVALARVLIVGFGGSLADAWVPMIAILAVASIVVGNLGAIVQERIKRMLAYSSIAHAGYFLIGLVAWQQLGVAALLYALAVYVAMTMGAFAVVLLHERNIGRDVTYADLGGTGWRWGLTGVAMVVLMLSLAGLPPTGGFFAKFGLFSAAIEANYAWLALVGVLGSAVSLVYYLRVLVAMYMTADSGARQLRQPVLATAAVALAAVTLLFGLVPGVAIDPARESADTLVAGDT